MQEVKIATKMSNVEGLMKIYIFHKGIFKFTIHIRLLIIPLIGKGTCTDCLLYQ
jgi:hypothetical protein